MPDILRILCISSTECSLFSTWNIYSAFWQCVAVDGSHFAPIFRLTALWSVFYQTTHSLSIKTTLVCTPRILVIGSLHTVGWPWWPLVSLVSWVRYFQIIFYVTSLDMVRQRIWIDRILSLIFTLCLLYSSTKGKSKMIREFAVTGIEMFFQQGMYRSLSKFYNGNPGQYETDGKPESLLY